ncbi:MAG: hypothetical protein GY774_37890 [Planctomycetes bacterium]|nr:hypothetical protein [Planctomycetota bacterium]
MILGKTAGRRSSAGDRRHNPGGNRRRKKTAPSREIDSSHNVRGKEAGRGSGTSPGQVTPVSSVGAQVSDNVNELGKNIKNQFV